MVAFLFADTIAWLADHFSVILLELQTMLALLLALLTVIWMIMHEQATLVRVGYITYDDVTEHDY